MKGSCVSAGIYGSQSREDYSEDDVEHYFNYMGMLATEVPRPGTDLSSSVALFCQQLLQSGLAFPELVHGVCAGRAHTTG